MATVQTMIPTVTVIVSEGNPGALAQAIGEVVGRPITTYLPHVEPTHDPFPQPARAITIFGLTDPDSPHEEPPALYPGQGVMIRPDGTWLIYDEGGDGLQPVGQPRRPAVLFSVGQTGEDEFTYPADAPSQRPA